MIFCAFVVVLGQVYLANPSVSSEDDKTCTLPPYPNNGLWEVVKGQAQPGDEVEANTVIKFRCKEGYKLTSNNAYMICDNDYDVSKVPECGRLCPPLYSSSTMTLKCIDRNGQETKCSEATDGTYLSYECAPFHETPLGYRRNLLCIDGSWNYQPVCQPICGKKINDDTVPLVYGGKVPTEIEYPWVAVIYREIGDTYLNICGGTIISRRVILTAAHCVTDDDGTLLPVHKYKVGVGKLYNRYNDANDTKAQYLEVSNIISNDKFKGESRRFLGDIALLLTKDIIGLSEVVQPVCINNINNIFLHVGDIGEIAGFGIDESGKPSQRIRVLKIPYKYEPNCASELPREWADKYHLPDKMCAGFTNMSKGICKGDSGSGLVFKNFEDNRYYIHGIASLAPGSKGQCNIQQNSLYTKVSFYFNFIDKELSKGSLEDCKLPAHPQHGQWVLADGRKRQPGDLVGSSTLLRMSCNRPYRLFGHPVVHCDAAPSDMPFCEKHCPPLETPPGTRTLCKDKDNHMIDCLELSEGHLSYSCSDDYISVPKGANTVRYCKDGDWNSSAPLCQKKIVIKENSTSPVVTLAPSPVISPTANGSASNIKVICTYASWWSYEGINPEDMDPFLCDYMVYAFAGIWTYGDVRAQDDNLDIDRDGRIGLYRRTTDLKRKNPKLKVILGIGGSAASNGSLFSDLCRDMRKTEQFIKSSMWLMKEYKFDGLDIDWPYPFPEPYDAKNFVVFLTAVRDAVKKEGYLLSASVRAYPDDRGYDAKGMNEVLDWVTIKSFDLYGPWHGFTGQNNALYFSSKEFNWHRNHFNVAACAKNWMNAGISRNKLVVSVAFYGRSFNLTDKRDHGILAPARGAGPGADGGFLRWNEICLLYENYTSVWDDEQKVNYKYKDNVWISYGDKDSVWIKGEYVKKQGFFGVNVYPLDGDDVLGQVHLPDILVNAFVSNDDNNNTCTLPPHPHNGLWEVVKGKGQPGDEVEANTVLKFKCNEGYKLTSSNAYMVCDNDFDTNLAPECGKLCPPLYSSSTTTLKCIDRNGQDIKCSEATDGTYLSYECAPFYETPMGYRRNLLCIDGAWNYQPVCQPICGRKINDDAIPLVYGGRVPTEIEYPWVATIYRELGNSYLNICGGTIISRRVILTAAHCVTDEDGNVLAVNKYKVGVGKLYNKYNDKNDTKAQYLNISSIISNDKFKGESRRYLGDIALLMTKDVIDLSEVVQPVCINNVNNIFLHVGDIGEIAGFGIDETGKPSQRIRVLKIPYKYETNCASELPREWADKYNLPDKMCAGFTNMSKGICRGDSGSGLVFKNFEDNRYYVHGIASLAPGSKGQCNIQQNSLYTKVSFYFNFIDKELSKGYLEDCKLPAYPEHGEWVLVDGRKREPGDLVGSGTLLRISCNRPYRLLGHPVVRCDAAPSDMPICEKRCPPLEIPPGTKTLCKDKSNHTVDCLDLTEGGYLSYSCSKDYLSLPKGAKTVRYCTDGDWSSGVPLCEKKIEIKENGTTPAPTRAAPSDRNKTTSRVKVICTYASWWSYEGMNPEDMDPFLCHYMVYAFAGIWSYGAVRVQDDYLDIDRNGTKGLYRRTTDLKLKNPKLKVILGIGGSAASNSSLFSDLCKDMRSVEQFIKSSMWLMKEYKFDGLDIDWLYPHPEPYEERNFVEFLKKVRDALKKEGYLLSASVRSYPDGRGYDAKGMNEILDWVTVKSFDFYGPWSPYTGQNNALYFSSKEYVWERMHLNLAASAKNWMDAGISKDKLVMSVAFFGRSFNLSDKRDHDLRAPITGAGPGVDAGFVRWNEICLNYENYTSVWDDEQKVNYKYKDNAWIGYGNKDSVWIKGQYIKKQGFFGVNVYPIDGDDILGKCGRKQQLLKHLHGGLGNNVDWDI
nr:unnamed protein product [Callosobruchus chinensis]